MTTPRERTQALMETKAFLSELLVPSLTPGVPDRTRQQAQHLLRHYPGVMELTLLHRALPNFFSDVDGSVRDS